METIYHADDFGITPEQSLQILSCSNAGGGQGMLNSLSILANSPHFEECVDLLTPYVGSFHVGIHLNVVEGPACCPAYEIPLLVDDDGYFKLSFVQLLLLSRGAQRAKLKEELKHEIQAQISKVIGVFPSLAKRLRIDSHQHFHLIPVMFEALLEVSQEQGYTLEYLRIPAEPHLPFLKVPRLFLTYRPVNFVKKLVLNTLWRRDKEKLGNYRQVSAMFCGILLSGKMDEERLRALIPQLEQVAQGRQMKLELLFHPGGVSSPDDCLNPKLRGFVDFYTSEGRSIEAQALKALANDHPGTDGKITRM